MNILGISCFYHDSAAALISKNKVIFACQEERFVRKKNYKGFPKETIKYIHNHYLKKSSQKINFIIFYEKPIIKFERLLETYLHFSPFRGYSSFKKSLPSWVGDKFYQKKNIIRLLKDILSEDEKELEKKILFSDHHLSHAASSFFTSTFEESAIITIDGVGEWTSTMIAHGKDSKIKVLKTLNFPHSLGLLYSAFTFYLGFEVNSGEYKVMGLAPYGEPKYLNTILDNLIHLKEDGSFYLDQTYFDYSTGLEMINNKFEKLFKKKTRKQNEQIEQFHMDIAASIQKILDMAVLNIAKFAKKITGSINLCYAGGVALNCKSNTEILKNNIFKNIWIPPSPGDAGAAIGAALYLNCQILQNQKKDFSNNKVFLGVEYSNGEISEYLNKNNIKFLFLEDDQLLEQVSEQLNNGKIIGWFNGRNEFSARALGSRSILASPKYKNMQKDLNLKTKFREGFRPFAPAVIEEKFNKWFTSEIKNPYMLFLNNVLDFSIDLNIEGFEKLNSIKSPIMPVTHVDGSARVQSVSKKQNKKFYDLIEAFEKKSGIPILINTSFNLRGEPIVHSIEDAVKCFLSNNIDFLVLENCILDKKEMPENLLLNKKINE
jgi:carbamoyltransferase